MSTRRDAIDVEALHAEAIDAEAEAPDVEVLAHTARIALDDEELGCLGPQLERVLALFAELASVDVEGVEPFTHPLVQRCALRDDVVGVGQGGATAEAVIAAADPSQLAEREGAPLFRVPAVLRRG